MDKVRIGFVGAGRMGQRAHLANYAAIDDCEVVALAEPRAKTARLVADRYGIGKVYSDHRAMLAAGGLDGVVASQPFLAHGPLLPEIYPHAKFLFTEKPLAGSVEVAERLVAAAAEAGCMHMVGYNKLSDLSTMHALAVIGRWKQSGECGPMRYVRLLMPPGDWEHSGFLGLLNAGDPPPETVTQRPDPDMDERAWRANVAFVNYYIHQVNLIRHLLGEPYHVTHADRAGVLLVAESESGVSGVIEMSPYRTTVDWQESALVAFENGCLKLRLPPPLAANIAGTLEVYEDPGDGAPPKRWSPVLPPVHAMRNQAVNFLRVCRGEISPPCDAAEAVEDLRIAREYIRRRYAQ